MLKRGAEGLGNGWTGREKHKPEIPGFAEDGETARGTVSCVPLSSELEAGLRGSRWLR